MGYLAVHTSSAAPLPIVWPARRSSAPPCSSPRRSATAGPCPSWRWTARQGSGRPRASYAPLMRSAAPTRTAACSWICDTAYEGRSSRHRRRPCGGTRQDSPCLLDRRDADSTAPTSRQAASPRNTSSAGPRRRSRGAGTAHNSPLSRLMGCPRGTDSAHTGTGNPVNTRELRRGVFPGQTPRS